MSQSRRAFLQDVSAAAAAGLLTQVPGRRLWAATPRELLAEPDEALLRELALTALDAARTGGATFADVRVATGREVRIRSEWRRAAGWAGPLMAPPELRRVVGYGVRALVDGTWGFAAGYELTPDGVRRAARAAVTRARATRPRRPRTLELAPAPRVADGRWATPIVQDPFTVELGEQADRQLAAIAAVVGRPEVRFASADFLWRRADRIFAASDGTLVIQRVNLALPSAGVSVSLGAPRVGSASVASFRRGGYGYEAVAGVDLTGELRQAADRALELARTRRAPTSAEVGRYDLVFEGQVLGRLLASTLAEAVNAERALGYQANQSGTSFAAPPGEVLGRLQVGSPLLTVRADRTLAHGAATVGWDDEGVAPDEFTFVENGVVMDYHTSRQTAAELAPWYRERGVPVRSHGCASGAGQKRPTVQLPNLTLVPGREGTAVEELIAGTKRGLYIDDLATGTPDQQLLNAQYSTDTWGAREIRNGQLGGWVKDLAFQFVTPAFWRSLDALGGPASATTWLEPTDYRLGQDPVQLEYASVRAVPARFRQVNVLNTGRTG